MNAKEEEIFQVAESCMEEMHDKKCFHAEILLSQGNNNQILVNKNSNDEELLFLGVFLLNSFKEFKFKN